MTRVLVTPRSLTGPDGAALLAPLAAAGHEIVRATPGRQPTADELRALLPGCVGWIAGVEPIGADVLDAAPQLRVISRNGAGVDNIDLEAARERGIRVTNNPGFCADEVAEHALGLFIAAERRIGWFDRHVRDGGWPPDDLPVPRRLADLTAGVVGLGAIGRKLVARLRPLVAAVRGYDPYQPEGVADDTGIPIELASGLEDLVSSVDAVFLQVPLTDSTRGMVNADLLARFRPGSTLINCARGAVCDETAVLDALNRGILRAAAFDTRVTEPLPRPDPLSEHPAVITTPHVAYLSEASLARAKEACVSEVLRLAAGLAPLNPVGV